MEPEPTDANPWEQRARAVKAFKIARAALRDLEPAFRELYPELSTKQLDVQIIAALEVARPQQRRRLAMLAKVREPSDATWEVMLGLLREMVQTRPNDAL